MTSSKIPPGLRAQLITLLAPLEAKPSPIEGRIQIKWRGTVYHLSKDDIFAKDSFNVTALWMRSNGSVIQMLAEVDNEFRLIREEVMTRPFSSIVRSAAFRRSPIVRRSA